MKKTHYDYNKKWRFKNPDKRYAQKSRYYAKTSNAANRCSKWTNEEIRLITDADLTDSELSQRLGRSVKAIQVKRCKVNQKVEEQLLIQDVQYSKEGRENDK